MFKRTAIIIICLFYIAIPTAFAQNIEKMAAEIAKNNIILLLETSKDEVYIGEAFIASYYLIVNKQISITDLKPTVLPKFLSLKSKELNIGELKYTDTIIDGLSFNKALIYQYLLIPQKSSSAKVDNIAFDLSLHIPLDPNLSQNYTSQYPDGFIDIKYSAISNTMSLKIKDLPANKEKPIFIGDFEIDYATSKITAKPNENIVLNVNIAGIGYLGIPFAPNVDKTNALKSNIYKTKDTFDLQNGEIISKKTYEIDLISAITGEYIVKPIQVLCFSPSYKEYYTLSTDAIPVFYVSEDIKIEAKSDGFDYFNIILGIILFGVFIVVTIFMLNHNKKQKDSTSRKAKTKSTKHDTTYSDANINMNKYLSIAFELINADTDIFLKELSLGIDEFIQDKFQIEKHKHKRSEIPQLLINNSVDAILANNYLQIHQKIEEMRFAPNQSNVDKEKLFYFIEQYLKTLCPI